MKPGSFSLDGVMEKVTVSGERWSDAIDIFRSIGRWRKSRSKA
jgi:hypothetical protein